MNRLFTAYGLMIAFSFCHYAQSVTLDASSFLKDDDFQRFKADLFDSSSLPDTRITNRKPLKIVVVGAGVAGLTAALHSYHAGARVTLVEKRTAYERANVVDLTKGNHSDLVALAGDENINKLISAGFAHMY